MGVSCDFMTNNEPTILTDLTRLQEIYNLRCLAWENGPYPDGVNFKNYPNGFYEKIDEKSIHFVIYNGDKEIIAASRLTHIQEFEELPYPKVFTSFSVYPNERPFLFYSRLVIHPNYRKMGLKQKMDKIRLQYQKDNQIAFSVATATDGRTKELIQYGFQKVADVAKDIDPDFPFKHAELLLLLQDINI